MPEPACGHLDATGVEAGLLARLGLTFPDIHTDGAAMARLSQGIKEHKGAALCQLPFCCTVEAEALGAFIRLGDAVTGPRAGAFVWSSLGEVLRLPPLDTAAGRMGQVLRACSLLAGAGQPVALEISGPLTILNWLMELAVVIREWRRDAVLMAEVLTRLQDDLAGYVLAAAKAGVSVLGYADPTGVLSILGPKRFAFMADRFVLPLLGRLQADVGGKAAVHVCPKIAHALVSEGRAQWQDLPLGRPMAYGQGCLAAGKSGLPLGEACLKNTGHFLKKGVIKQLVPA
ncbi:uroporphyrinogen decarboxylase family protein [Desulfovibrio sp. TomC]|uniref:uroporphyrinogen decarboxylase family protein n=1 Tax=Desulfovibrio sp. TomC TaxID=1562888 RepID=UPI0005744854|nr:uroporphyrinogen decarboxylase family protein [Desulfovibrio sp. TomC]KHK03957.1 Methylcobalamin methyltransferase MMP0831 [Desulfovibrio sp. TomC]